VIGYHLEFTACLTHFNYVNLTAILSAQSWCILCICSQIHKCSNYLLRPFSLI